MNQPKYLVGQPVLFVNEDHAISSGFVTAIREVLGALEYEVVNRADENDYYVVKELDLVEDAFCNEIRIVYSDWVEEHLDEIANAYGEDFLSDCCMITDYEDISELLQELGPGVIPLLEERARVIQNRIVFVIKQGEVS